MAGVIASRKRLTIGEGNNLFVAETVNIYSTTKSNSSGNVYEDEGMQYMYCI